MPLATCAIGKRLPMRPVEQTSQSRALDFVSLAVCSTIVLASAMPSTPVQALAQPELMTTPKIFPLPRCFIETLTGAALTRLVVKVAAASAGTSETTSAMSFSPAGLMPQATPAARNPCADDTPPPLIVLASMDSTVFTPAPGLRPGRRRCWLLEWLGKHCLCQDCRETKKEAAGLCGHQPGR